MEEKQFSINYFWLVLAPFFWLYVHRIFSMAGLDGRMVGQAVIYVDHRHRYKHLCKPSCKYVGEYVRKRHTYVTTELMRLLPTTFSAAADCDDVSFFLLFAVGLDVILVLLRFFFRFFVTSPITLSGPRQFCYIRPKGNFYYFCRFVAGKNFILESPFLFLLLFVFFILGFLSNFPLFIFFGVPEWVEWKQCIELVLIDQQMHQQQHQQNGQVRSATRLCLSRLSTGDCWLVACNVIVVVVHSRQ